MVKEDNGLWDLPGGGLEHGETVEECIKRELGEESSFEVTRIEMKSLMVATYKDKKDWWITNIFVVTEADTSSFVATDECTEYKFFSLEEAVKMPVYQSVDELAKLLKT